MSTRLDTHTYIHTNTAYSIPSQPRLANAPKATRSIVAQCIRMTVIQIVGTLVNVCKELMVNLANLFEQTPLQEAMFCRLYT